MIKRRKQHVQIIFTKKYFISLPSRGLSRQKKKERREIVLYHVFYHACNDVSLTSSNVLVTCDTTYRTGLCNTNGPISKIALAEWGLETGFCMFTQLIHSWLITAEITDRFYAKYSLKKTKQNRKCPTTASFPLAILTQRRTRIRKDEKSKIRRDEGLFSTVTNNTRKDWWM